MRLADVRVELRPRSPWEAVELGTALVRRHAGAIWRPWALCTLPVFALANAAAWAIEAIWLATLLMWWLLPLFDRIVLFVLSRAVFGDAPGTRQAVAALFRQRWHGMAARLSVGRFSPWRTVAMPVDLLEGLDGAARQARLRVVVEGNLGHGVLLWLLCPLFVAALTLSLLALVLMFVPEQLLGESARAMWALVAEQPPPAVQVALNAALWLALSAIEPFFVGAGFGLYLSRRARIEAWDIELVLRRLRARVSTAAVLALAMAGTLAWPLPAQAQMPQRIQEERERQLTQARGERAGQAEVEFAGEGAGRAGGRTGQGASTTRLEDVFGKDAIVDHAPFRQSVKRAYEDPLLNRSRTQTRWERRDPEEHAAPSSAPAWLRSVGKVVAMLGEYGLWLLLGGAVLALALTARRWWPWLRGTGQAVEAPSEILSTPAPREEGLPVDLAAAVRALWREGRPRRALALLYRGSVEAMAAHAGLSLAPGATEAECLRASRRLPDAGQRDAFARMVQVWQLAAYARRLPGDAAFDALVGELSLQFGWSR